MDDKFKKISENIVKQMCYVETEEATKNAFVLPFLDALGYNIFDPMEVVPEFTADVGIKKGEKVDYAIMKDLEPILLIECKPCTSDLENEHFSQLYRYFSSTAARFGILTNGIVYKFYTDIEEPNQMDSKPFLEVDMLKLDEMHVKELKKFSKGVFDLGEILHSASELKYTGEIKKIISKELTKPSDEFVRFFAKKVYSGPITERVRLKFMGITKMAMNQFIKDQVSTRLKSALEASNSRTEDEVEVMVGSNNIIVTTKDEWEGYYIIKSLLHEVIDSDRVAMRDTMSYCGILLDNRKTICRLYFNNEKNKRILLYDDGKKGEKISIMDLKDIYNYSDRLKAIVKYYDTVLP